MELNNTNDIHEDNKRENCNYYYENIIKEEDIYEESNWSSISWCWNWFYIIV